MTHRLVCPVTVHELLYIMNYNTNTEIYFHFSISIRSDYLGHLIATPTIVAKKVKAMKYNKSRGVNSFSYTHSVLLSVNIAGHRHITAPHQGIVHNRATV